MAVAVVVGLAGGRAQHVAAVASVSPQIGTPAPPSQAAVTDSSLGSVSDLYSSLYAPTDPTDWCSIGGPPSPGIGIDDNGSLSLAPWCQAQNGRTAPYITGATNYELDTTTCTGVQGPAGDASIDPSGLALNCVLNSGGSNGPPFLNPSTNENGYLDWTIWALITGTTGTIGGWNSGEIDYFVTGSGLEVTSDYNGLAVTLTPPTSFTQETNWLEISQTDNTTTGSTCLSFR